MSSWRLIFASLALAAFATTGRASLGEDGYAVERRYGDPSARRLRDDGSVAIIYHKDRYYYFVVFQDGRSVLEKFSRMDWRDLSPKEIAHFLKANAGGQKWIASGAQQYRRSDGKAEAALQHEDGKPLLIVRTIKD